MSRKIKDVAARNPETMNIELAFAGTRVPAKSLVEHLEDAEELSGARTA